MLGLGLESSLENDQVSSPFFKDLNLMASLQYEFNCGQLNVEFNEIPMYRYYI